MQNKNFEEHLLLALSLKRKNPLQLFLYKSVLCLTCTRDVLMVFMYHLIPLGEKNRLNLT